MDTLSSLLKKQFLLHPSRPALQGETVRLNYAELATVSAVVAEALVAGGVRPGDIAALCMRRSPELVVAQVALARLGIGYAPLDLTSPVERLRTMLRTLGDGPLIGDGCCPPSLREGCRYLDIQALWPTGPLADATGADLPEPCATSLAAVMFTSGTTGAPKGVAVPGDGIVRLVHEADYAQFGPDQRWAFLSSPAFDASTLEVWGPLFNGGCCVVQEDRTPSLDDLADFLLREQITDTWLTSALFSALVEDRPDALGGLRQVLTGGERVSPRHARLLLERYPRLRLINGYGPTENTTFTLCHTITLADTHSPAGIPIGRPISGTTVRVEPSGPGSTEGELWAGGRGVAHGYLGEPELTARKFVEHEGQRYYRTGDIVRQREDGVFEFIGRVDRQVKIQGHRIELDEVEGLLAACPGVGDAALLVLGDQPETRHIVACYRGQGGPAPLEELVAAYLGERLPPAALPRRYHILERFPLTRNGKIDRAALEQSLSTATPSPDAPDGLVRRLAEMIRSHAGRPVLEGANETLSYRELDRRSEALASLLLRAGVRAGEPVPLFLPRSPFLVVAMLACVRCGVPYVPVDLASPPARIARVLAALKPRVVITDGHVDQEELRGCTRIDRRDLDASGVPDTPLPWPETVPDEPLYIMFTSGSTGDPKGVVVPHRGVFALLVGGDVAEFPDTARWLQVTSPAFDISNLEIWGALLNGACCVIQEAALPALEALAQFITTRSISHIQMSTALFNAMVDLQPACFAGAVQVVTGGERASPPHMRKFLLDHSRVRLINAYGPTETTIWSLTRTVTPADTDNPSGIPIGLPIRGTQCRLDPETSPSGEGELLIGGAGVALGYLNDPEKTAARFVELDGRRWYRTGDLARRRDDGVYEFLGRIDRQVKIQGHRIELDEVELLLAACPGVGEVAVLVRGDEAGNRHLVAFYSGLAGSSPSQEELTGFLEARLPDAAVPKLLICLERLPMNTNGKVDRRALAALLEVDHAAPDRPGEPGLWQNPEEAALAALWGRVLPATTLDRDTHFLRVGGTSLLALRLADLIRKELGRDLPPVEVLRHPVLADQARLLATAPRVEDQVAETTDSGTVPLTRAQQALLAAGRLDSSGCAYLVHVALLLAERPDTAAWQRAFASLASRHPSLRLTARVGGERAVATLRDTLPDGWWRTGETLNQPPRDLAWPESLLREINRPLDLAVQGVMRVDCHPVSGGGALLVWTVHHFVMDEASIFHCLAELDLLLQGRRLPPVYGSPFGFPSLEAAWTDKRDLEAVADQLVTSLAGQLPPLGRAPGPGYETAFTLDLSLTEELRACCRAIGGTPFAPLLTAFGLALQELFGASFRFVSTPFSRRVEPELMEPVGYWLDVRFIEAGTRDGETIAETVRRVQEAVVQAQRPGFQPLDLLTQEVTRRDFQAAQLLTQFGFTWRLDPARSVTLGNHHANLLRAPQLSARYSLCLHAAQIGEGITCSIEAVHDGSGTDLAAAVRVAFVRCLAQVCAEVRDAGAELRTPAPHVVPVIPGSGIDPERDAVLRAAWVRWLGGLPSSVQPHSDFLRSGGSSLTAMRLAAQLRREQGLRLDVGAFLARPMFARLTELVATAAETAPAGPQGWVLIGPAGYRQVLLVVPGTGGEVAGLYGLAQELLLRLPAGTAVAILDLDRLLSRSPPEQRTWFAVQSLAQYARELDLRRLAGLAGFSFGGLLALLLARELDAGRRVPVWLIDTYLPRAFGEGFWRKVERNLAWGFLGGRPPLVSPQPEATLEGTPLRTPQAIWDQVHDELGTQSYYLPQTPVHLIQAEETVQRVGLLWRRSSNGFSPGTFGAWERHLLDCSHLDLARHRAGDTAETIARGIHPVTLAEDAP